MNYWLIQKKSYVLSICDAKVCLIEMWELRLACPTPCRYRLRNTCICQSGNARMWYPVKRNSKIYLFLYDIGNIKNEYLRLPILLNKWWRKLSKLTRLSICEALLNSRCLTYFIFSSLWIKYYHGSDAIEIIKAESFN